MKLMQIIAEISEDDYNRIINKSYRSNDPHYSAAEYAIAHGTVLPDDHGRLIDADAFERRCMFDSDIEDMQDVIYALRDYKSIIEAR